DDESELSLDEVLQRAADIAGLVALARRERYNSDFDWTVVLRRFAVNSSAELLPLARALRYNRGVRSSLFTRSRGYREANDTGGAWGSARLALEATTRFAWSRRTGDGSALDAARALVNARPREGRRVLWRLLTTDPTPDVTDHIPDG